VRRNTPDQQISFTIMFFKTSENNKVFVNNSLGFILSDVLNYCKVVLTWFFVCNKVINSVLLFFVMGTEFFTVSMWVVYFRSVRS